MGDSKGDSALILDLDADTFAELVEPVLEAGEGRVVGGLHIGEV